MTDHEKQLADFRKAMALCEKAGMGPDELLVHQDALLNRLGDNRWMTDRSSWPPTTSEILQCEINARIEYANSRGKQSE